ncbi:MAG: alpha/beta fold hydrolase [Phycisphaera sp.]|nr:MAG: alpha/beta fold hydrolase [Phycisphaera sp.]
MPRVLLLIVMGLASACSEAQRVDLVEQVRGQPFYRYETTDEFDRIITFYISEPVGDDDLPLVVWIQGSGFGSHFQERDGRVARVGGSHSVVEESRGRARVLLIEKPGTSFLDVPEQPGSAVGSPVEFREQHTLDRWAAAIEAAIRASWAVEQVSRDRVLVMGHSEGGIVSAAVAARMPEVTHVALLAGGGPTQLYSLLRLARQGAFGAPEWTADEAESWLLTGWERVLNDPESADALYLGHPHRRWSTFMTTSPAALLDQSDAFVFIGQGLEDRAVDPSSADVLYAQLLSKGRRVEQMLVKGADHSFNRFEDGEYTGSDLGRVVKRAIDLMLEDESR